MDVTPLVTPLANAVLTGATQAGFERSARTVLRFLREQLPMGYWSVSRIEGGYQRYLYLDEDAYDVHEGDQHAWESSFCIRMVADEAPRVAPNVAEVPAYARAEAELPLQIGAYVGIPVRDIDGALFGTICGLDPDPVGADYVAYQPWLELLAQLLTDALQSERQRMTLAREAERAANAALTDDLTKLANRRAWDRLAAAEAARLRTVGDPGLVLIIDLDGLKRVNDTEGHDAGDDYLRRAAEALEANVPREAITARLGGDEFAVLIPSARREDGPSQIARLEHAFRAAAVGASIGCAVLEFAEGLRAAMERADARMYEAKQARRAGRDIA